MLAKLLRYLQPALGAAWSKADFAAASNQTGVTFALGAGLASGEPKSDIPELQQGLPEKSVNYGQMPKAAFLLKVAQTKVLVGVGNPLMSI